MSLKLTPFIGDGNVGNDPNVKAVVVYEFKTNPVYRGRKPYIASFNRARK